VIGAIIGIGLAKGGRNIRLRVLGRISSGWLATPLVSAVIAFVALFFVQNVFSQQVYTPVRYQLSGEVVSRLDADGIYDEALADLLDREFETAAAFSAAVQSCLGPAAEREGIVARSRLQPIEIDTERVETLLSESWLTGVEKKALVQLRGRRFRYAWQLDDALAAQSKHWRPRPPTTRNKLHNKELRAKLTRLEGWFALPQQ
jgi:PiT family inorganic phosphate transporter